MNDVVATPTQQQVAWPDWVINEISNAIYKSRGGERAMPGAWAKANDNERKLYEGYTHAALQWIVDAGWVKLP